MQVTLDLPEELWGAISGLEAQIPQVLLLGLQELRSRPQEGFHGFAEVFEFLAGLPTPEEVLALRPSVSFQTQLDLLSAKYKAESLTAEEMLFWRQYEYLEHVVRMAKARAYLKLQERANAA